MTKAELAQRKRTPRMPAYVSAGLESRLLSYAAAASAAGVGLLALAKPAEARIVYKTANVKIFDSSHYLVLNDQGTPNFLLSNVYFTSPGSGGMEAQIQVAAVHRGSFIETATVQGAAALYAGDRIPPADKSHGFRPGGLMLRFVLEIPGGSTYAGAWRNAANRYLGLKFQQDGKTHYGWARLTMVDGRFCAGLLTGYAYETVPNKPIVAGKTKEADEGGLQPATLGHLARGSSALAGWRSGAGAPTH